MQKKILISGDDFELHEINSITASACDLVLTTCPLSVLKYKEKGYKAYFMVYENYKTNKVNNEKNEVENEDYKWRFFFCDKIKQYSKKYKL